MIFRLTAQLLVWWTFDFSISIFVSFTPLFSLFLGMEGWRARVHCIPLSNQIKSNQDGVCEDWSMHMTWDNPNQILDYANSMISSTFRCACRGGNELKSDGKTCNRRGSILLGSDDGFVVGVPERWTKYPTPTMKTTAMDVDESENNGVAGVEINHNGAKFYGIIHFKIDEKMEKIVFLSKYIDVKQMISLLSKF